MRKKPVFCFGLQFHRPCLIGGSGRVWSRFEVFVQPLRFHSFLNRPYKTFIDLCTQSSVQESSMTTRIIIRKLPLKATTLPSAIVSKVSTCSLAVSTNYQLDLECAGSEYAKCCQMGIQLAHRAQKL